MIANNDEAKRSKIWTVVTAVTSVLIVIIAIFLLMKMFTGNPLEGSWTDEDGNMDLKIGRNGQMTVILPASGDGEETQVPMTYTLSKESKTISIQEDDNKIQEIAEKSNGQYTEETLKNAVQSIGTAYAEGADALAESPSAFERWCDNRIIQTISPEKYHAFTIGPVIAYVIARQNEIKTVRIILSGKQNELPDDSIRERVREMYV